MPESQQHGFVWQADIMANVYRVPAHVIATECYTATHDIPAAHNALDHVNLSIKTTGNAKRVDMGDALRIYDTIASGEGFHMVVIHWEQEGLQKKLVSITEVSLTGALHSLFGTLTREELVALDTAVKAYPKGCSAKDPRCAPITALCEQLCSKSGAIQLNKKIDSKSQRRLQCSFHNFTKFLTDYPERVVAQSSTSVFRGGSIQSCIESSPRVRTAKIEAPASSL